MGASRVDRVEEIWLAVGDYQSMPAAPGLRLDALRHQLAPDGLVVVVVLLERQR